MVKNLRGLTRERTNYPPNYPQVMWTEMINLAFKSLRQKIVAQQRSQQPVPLGATNVQLL
jgi:hypothetical protein